jgi:hypothetical protein
MNALTQKSNNAGTTQEKFQIVASHVYETVMEQMDVLGFINDDVIAQIAYDTQLAFEAAVEKATGVTA